MEILLHPLGRHNHDGRTIGRRTYGGSTEAEYIQCIPSSSFLQKLNVFFSVNETEGSFGGEVDSFENFLLSEHDGNWKNVSNFD
jgi:hypothetical protein